MIAFARIEFAMVVEEFLMLTVGQWAALVCCHSHKIRRQDEMLELMAAQLIAMVANTGFKGFKDPRNPQEFMPSKWSHEAQPVASKRLTKSSRKKIAEETRAIMRTIRLGR